MNWMPKRSIPLLLAMPVAGIMFVIGLVIGCAVTLCKEGRIWMELK